MLIPFLIMLVAPEFTDADRDDAIASYVQCAAFHRIEAEMATGDEPAADAHRASAGDFLEVALHLAGSAKADAVNSDLASVETDYRSQLKKGEVRAVAEGWTQLESACKELHLVREALLGKPDSGEGVR